MKHFRQLQLVRLTSSKWQPTSQILLMLLMCSLSFINATAQKEAQLQKTKALLQQDKHIASFEMNEKRGTPESISFNNSNTYLVSETENLLHTYFTSRKGTDFYHVKNETIVYGNVTVIRYQQYFKGLPVEFGEIVAVSKGGMLSNFTAESYVPVETKAVIPLLSEGAALNKALNNIKAARYAWQEMTITEDDGGSYPKGELVLMPDLRAGKTGTVLAWKFDIYALEPLSRDYVYISAEDGSLIFRNAIIKHTNATGTAATRYSGTKTITTNSTGTTYQLKETSSFMNGIETYNMNRGTNYSTATTPTDNDNNWTATEYNNTNKDNAILDAHWGAEQVVAYWKNIHNRRSYDNKGSVLKSYTHYSSNYDNAYWSQNKMVYGDGSGGADGFSPLTSLDVCAHEIGHGVCENTCNLTYSGESGGMNEGFSDIWAACLENYVDPANTMYSPFLIGEQIAGSSFGGFLRNMANPPADGISPDTYTSTVGSLNVHYSSGILNKWFYVVTRGESGTNDLGNAYNVTGLGFAKAEKIAFLTETSLTANANYAAARTAAIGAAITLYGACSPEVQTVTNAWYAVGVGSTFVYTCSPYVQFLSAGATVAETNTSNDCHPGKDVTATMVLTGPVTQAVNISLNNFGTAKLGKDFTIAPSTLTFTPGGPASQNFTITVYDNAVQDYARTLILKYSIDNGNAVTGSDNQEYDLRILDDDNPPLFGTQGATDTTLLSETFTSLNSSGLPANWANGSFATTAGNNVWVGGANGTIGDGNAAYISNNATTKPWAYTATSASDVYLRTPALNAVNASNMTLSFDYQYPGGEINDYGSVYYTFNNTDIIEFPNASLYPNTQKSTYTIDLPDSIFANQTFYIGFHWRNNNTGGSGNPLSIDNVKITGKLNHIAVETDLGNNKDEYIAISDPLYFFSRQNHKVIARILNASETIGCVNGTITQAGSGMAPIYINNSTYYNRTQKVFQFTPATPNSTTTYRMTLYFTPAELAIWGSQRLNLKVMKVKDGVDLNAPLNSSDYTIITPVNEDIVNAGGYAFYTFNATGFSQFMLINPTIILPLKLLSFTAAPFSNYVNLKWNTSAEVNTQSFIIERSADGSTGWSAITTIAAKGQGNGSYTANDFAPFDGKNYYRLKMIDKDGQFSYSLVELVSWKKVENRNFVLVPNPATSQTTLYYNKLLQSPVITVYDAEGRLITQYKQSGRNNNYQLNTTMLASGNYTITVTSGSERFNQKLVVQK